MTTAVPALVARVQQGEPNAFADLVAGTISDVRLFIATYVPTTALVDALLREAYAAIRQEIARCPADDAQRWMCRTAGTLIGMRLADTARAGGTKDPLTHIITQRGAEALSLNAVGDNPAAVELPRRLRMQPPSLQQLLQRHYQEGLTVATIAEKQGLVEGEVAQALLAARARMDWTGVAEVGDTADKTFPSVLEDYLGGTLVPDARAVLVAGVMHDPTREVQFERQVRMHLLLQVLMTPMDQAQVKEFTVSLPGFRNESSRLIVPPRRGTGRITANSKPGSGPRPRGETSRNRRQITETGSPGRGFVANSSASRTTAVVDNDLGEDAPPPPNRMPLYLGGGAAVLGLLVLVVMWLRPSTPVQIEVAASTDQAAPVVLGDPSFALISQADGQPLIRHAGQTRPAANGDALSSGDGLVLNGAGALGVLIADQVRLSMRADSEVTRVALDQQQLVVEVAKGRVQVDHRKGARVAGVQVKTPEGLTTVSEASVAIEAASGTTRVQVGRGKSRVSRPDGAGAIEAQPGGVVMVRAGVDPALDGAGTFARGINFGEGTVTIGSNQWLSLSEALGAGLTLAPSAHLGESIQISGSGLDFDSRRMLDMGLVGDGNQIGLTQVLPNGAFDLSLWIAGRADAHFEQLALTIGGTAVPIGPPASKAERWRRYGPYRVQISNRLLDLRLTGLVGAHLAGLQLDAAGKLDGGLPPMILIADPAPGAELPPLELPIRTRVDAAGGVAKVTFFNGETQIGEATTPPYTFVWPMPPVGPLTLSAVVTDATGVTSRSAVVAGTVKPLSESHGLLREVWRRVGGGSVGDLRGRLASPASEVELVSDSNQRLNGVDFGARFRATVTPPMDGEYIIEVVSDDGSEVWLSPDADPANRQLVCSLGNYVDFNQWAKVPSQRSLPVKLAAGKPCFIEVLYKQGGGGAHLQLGWTRPDGAVEHPIPSERFTPVRLSGPIPPPRPVAPMPVGPAPATPITAQPGAGAGPAVIARVVPSAPAGPLLQGSVAPSPVVANLSDLGPSDWIHYGFSDAQGVNRRLGGDQLAVVRTADNAEIKRYDNNNTRFGWDDGTPMPAVAAVTTGWFTNNRGKGFTCTAPADPVLRRLLVFVGGHDTHGIFHATLSDESAPAYHDESINCGDNGWYCYTLLYRAKNNGAKLTLSYSSDKANDGNVTFQAVALAEFGDGKPRFVRGIDLSGESLVVDGNPWIGQKEAEAAGLLINNGRRVSGPNEPVPATDAGMKAMLRTGMAAKSDELEIHDRGVPNGRYQVTLYVAEGGSANSRLFDVTIGEAMLAGIGQLPKNGWAAYGPVTTTVTKNVLSIIAKGKKGAPQLMGIAVHTAAADGPWTNAFPAGRPHAIPGSILFADFDRGINGVAFQERDDKPHNPFYRPEVVGINQYQGRPVIAYTGEGEWLRYTLAAKEAGSYTLTVQYGKANGGDPQNARVQFELDGVPVGGELRLEDTLRWDVSKTVTSMPFPLTIGPHDLRAIFHGDQPEIGDFWSMEFKKVGP